MVEPRGKPRGRPVLNVSPELLKIILFIVFQLNDRISSWRVPVINRDVVLRVDKGSGRRRPFCCWPTYGWKSREDEKEQGYATHVAPFRSLCSKVEGKRLNVQFTQRDCSRRVDSQKTQRAE
jgi:hypothetical protein